MSAAAARPRSEGLIILLVGAIQFINILDFMIPMPMGPDLAHGLGIPISQIGLIGGSYTAAAALSGLVGSFFLDRFDRRKAVAVAMFGLVLGTAAGGLAQGMGSLMLARVVAGVFGGPATSLSMSIVADVVPAERRGAALSKVAMAFAVASVMGVPFALELSQRLGWRAPFFVVAGAGLLVVGLAVAALPPMRGHLERGAAAPHRHALREALEIVRRPEVQLSYLTTAVVMAGGFILIPNISAFVQGNLGYPREHLGLLYLAGGIASLACMQFVGRLVDRYGSFRIGLVGAVMLSLTVFVGFIGAPPRYPPWYPVMALYVAFMAAAAFRNLSYNTLASRVPQPQWRARFMSFQSAVQHLASALGASASAWILVETPDHRLLHIEVVAWLCILLTLVLPPLLFTVERRVNAREASKASAQVLPLQPAPAAAAAPAVAAGRRAGAPP